MSYGPSARGNRKRAERIDRDAGFFAGNKEIRREEPVSPKRRATEGAIL